MQHIYKYFNVVNVCDRLLCTKLIKWNDDTKRIEANNSFWAMARFYFLGFILLCLSIDTYYYTLMNASDVELAYLIELIVLIGHFMYNYVHMPKVEIETIVTLNDLNTINEILLRYHRRNDSKTIMKIALGCYNFLCVLSTLKLWVMLVIHFRYPYCKMYTLQFILHSFLYPLLMSNCIIRTVLSNRLAVTNDFIRSTKTKADVPEYCEICANNYSRTKKLICDLHKVKYVSSF